MQRKRGWEWELAGGGLAAALGLAANIFGSAHIARLWLILGLACLAIAGASIARAATEWGAPTRGRASLLVAVTALVALLTGAAGYHQWFDPSRSGSHDYEYTLATSDRAYCAHLYGEPGGTPLISSGLDNPACGGATVLVRCRTDYADEGWLRQSRYLLWIRESEVRLRHGASASGMPNC